MKAEPVAKNGEAKPGAEEGGKLGLAVRALTPEEKKQLGGNATGLVVERAIGPAAKAGLRRGDLITAVNGRPVKSVEELREMVSKAKDNVALLVRRGDSTVFVPIEIG
jgi:serine protease Do